MDVAPDREAHDIVLIGNQHDAGLEVERHESLQNTRHCQQRQCLFHIGFRTQNRLPVTVVTQCPGFQHGRETQLGHRPTQRRLVVDRSEFGSRQTVVAGIPFLPQTIL